MTRATGDPIWDEICVEVKEIAESEPMLAGFLHTTILRHDGLVDALGFHLASLLGGGTIHEMTYREVLEEAMTGDKAIVEAIRADLRGVLQRDPACTGYASALLYFKGFQALEAYRAANWLWKQDRKALAFHMQSRISARFGVDIHPAARIGRGILIDHANGVVIGETAIVEDDVSMLHDVTLGGTGKETGQRHPRIRSGVLIGAGAKILGNIEVGEGAKVAAGSVVLKDVPPHRTVAGVPAVVVGRPLVGRPALDMDQDIFKDGAVSGGLGI